MVNGSTAHEVLAVVFQVRPCQDGSKREKPQLNVLLWERARDPQRGAWSLPGGRLRHDEDMTSSVRRQLAEKVDLRELAHLEQLAVFSDPDRVKILSTGGMLEAAHQTHARQVLVATEVGMLYQLRRAAPDVDFRAVNDRASCKYMKMITPAALLRCLLDGADEVDVDAETSLLARRSVQRMIAIGQPGGGE